MQGSARKDGATRVYTVAVPGRKWKSWLIGSCDGGGFDAVFSPSARESAETKMEGVSYAAFI